MSTKKLVKHVTSGRLGRVKRYLREEKRRLIEKDRALADRDAWMDEIRVRSKSHCYGDETFLLHLTASTGDERVLRYLLKLGFGRRQGYLRQRIDSQTPLHLAVARCHRTLESRGGKGAIEDYQDYVKPILDACPEALKVKNQFGQRGSSVLEELQADIAREEMGGGDPDDDDDCRERGKDDHPRRLEEKEEEKRWREKMRDECELEIDASSGPFERARYYWQEVEDERTRETFKEFADRIEREYRQRFYRTRREKEKEEEKEKAARRGAAATGSSTTTSKKKEMDPLQRKRYEEMKRAAALKNKKLDYERRWDEFVKNDRRYDNDDDDGDSRRYYAFDELPWPLPLDAKIQDGEARKKWVAEMVEIATFTVADEDGERERKLEMKRWHPDKVMQRIRVKPEDAEFVALLVKEVAQALNSLKLV